ncbi:Inner membrane protein YdcO [Legionella santicrucis]|uniref:Inner membrane protein YdcO n=2 Tax=Legionella santicrucis TaxID=45074 RepID=A0A0W0Y9T9_9GAMM|nr:Inner membrane protein YdcO [Legionella santicrucis]
MANWVAGLLAVVVGFTSSAAIVFQAAAAAGANNAEVSSWILALGVGTSLSSIGLSWYYRIPILTAWSTPGAALLVSSLAGFTLPQAIGAFLFSGLLVFIVGITGWFERAMVYIPKELAAAMLAGVLLHFGVNLFVALQSEPLLVSAMIAGYFIGKRFYPRYMMMIVLIIGILVAWFHGLLIDQFWQFALTKPVWITPEFTGPALIGVGIPLCVVTMTSQNIPGIAVMQAAGYKPSISKVISCTGLTNLLIAPFGGFSCNLAAITAAICSGEEADIDPQKRYRAVYCAGIFYLLMGLFASTVVSLFSSFPQALILAIAGLALFVTIGTNLQSAFSSDEQREPALVTLMITASGINAFGVSAAFWGLLAGMISNQLLVNKQRVLLKN